jgi:hypothetical protein
LDKVILTYFIVVRVRPEPVTLHTLVVAAWTLEIALICRNKALVFALFAGKLQLF